MSDEDDAYNRGVADADAENAFTIRKLQANIDRLQAENAWLSEQLDSATASANRRIAELSSERDRLQSVRHETCRDCGSNLSDFERSTGRDVCFACYDFHQD